MSNQPNDTIDSHSGLDITRRAALALAGGIGAAGLMSTEASADPPEQEGPAFQYEQVVGEKGWMYDTIQAAHDDLGEYGGGIIFVTDNYDSEQEQFPVTLTNYVRVVGANRGSTTIDATDSERPVFKIHEGRDIPHYDWTTTIENLRIVGGDIGILITGETHALLENLVLVDQTSHGVSSINERESGKFDGAFLNYLRNVDVHWPGSHGIHLEYESTPHAALLDRCAVERCGGNGAFISGAAVSVRGGAYEKNAKNGIEIRDGDAVTIRDAYLESNGEEDSQYGHIYLRGQRPMLPDDTFTGEVVGVNGVVIEGNYLHRISEPSRVGIHMEDTRTALIQGNSFAGYTDPGTGCIYIDDTCRDIDYSRASNIPAGLNRGEEENFVLKDNGYRTRSNGVIQAADLSTVKGEFENDRAIDDGTNTPTGAREIYLWYDGSWHSGNHTIGSTTVDSDASVTFTANDWDGKHLPIEEAVLPDGGFVAIRDLDGFIVGTSEYLQPGTHTDLEITFDEQITPDRRHPTHWLNATLHKDTNGNEQFDYSIDTPEQIDEPYVNGTRRVNDGTQTTVVTGD